jgi:4-hydroxybutyrate CoA-transferase
MTWKDQYSSKVASPEQAVKTIQSGNRIFLTGNCSVPQQLIKSLVDLAPDLKNVEICQALTVGNFDYTNPEMEGHLRVNSLFISPNVRKAVQEGRADFTPVLLSELPLLFKRGILPLDVALVHLSPPDADGFCSFGVEAGLSITAAESARIIIAEINDQMPRTYGDTLIHVSKLSSLVPVDYPLAERAMSAEGSSDIIQKIAAHIADIIPDGATLQTGIGSIPDAVLKYLGHKKNLSIHSELISDGVIDLVEAGVINCSQKTLHPDKIVCGFLIGTQRLYTWANKNPLLELHRTEYVNSPIIIAKNRRMVALNSAIEVDLTGQVCADSLGCKFYSGIGGQMDFIYGASLAEEGLPIIALPSTTMAKDGTLISKIAISLNHGAGVTTTRNHVHFIATEYGITDLYGKTIQQRARALISIAHPDFRDELTFNAKKLCYL